MAEKIGEATRERIMEVVKNALTAEGLDVLRVASGSFGIPAVEGEEETAIRIVFQIPKGARDGEGYDVYEEAQSFEFKRAEAEKKRQKRAEEKAKKIAKTKKESE